MLVNCTLFSNRCKYNCFSTIAGAFETIARTGHSEHKFSLKPISNATIQKIIELTQLAPSSFNLQPYKIIVVRSSPSKNALSQAMLGANSAIVLNAPITVVFASLKGKRIGYGCIFGSIIHSTDPTSLTRKLMRLESENGTNSTYVASLPSKISVLFGSGWISSRLKSIGSHLVSPLSPAPKLTTSSELWAVKNTAFAAQQLMLAATSLGVATAPMEGFDEPRLCFEMGIPSEEYTVPLVISLGYSADSTEKKAKLRFKMEDVCFSEKYGMVFNLEET